MSKEAMRIALKALVSSTGELHLHLASPTDAQLLKNHQAITALRQALEQPEQEPAAWYHTEDYKTHFTTEPSHDLIGKYWLPLYTTPQPCPEQPADEPVAWATRESFYKAIDRAVENVRQEMRVKTVKMRCEKFDLALPIIGTYGGHVLVGEVATNPSVNGSG
jgi:hypothetical protein